MKVNDSPKNNNVLKDEKGTSKEKGAWCITPVYARAALRVRCAKGAVFPDMRGCVRTF